MSAVDFDQFREKYGKDKLLHPANSDRLIEWMQGKNVPPITVMICPTDRCHHQCPQCVGGRIGVENLKNMKGIINQLADYGVKSLVVSGGGEPLLNRETPEAIELAREKGMDIGLVTNGDVPLPDSKLTQIIKSVNWIRVSMDGANPDQFAHSHGMDSRSFERMLQNTANMVRVRNVNGLQSCDIGTGYLTDDVTKQGIVQATKICKDMGLGYIQFRPFFYNETNIDTEFEEAKKFAGDGFRVLRSEYRYDEGVFQSGYRGYKKCMSPNFETTIAATGKVYLCCHTTGNDNYELGNVNEKSFSEIWESNTKQELMEAITFKDCPPICKWHVTNNVLYSIKDIGVTTDQVREISDSRHGEVYPTAKIL